MVRSINKNLIRDLNSNNEDSILEKSGMAGLSAIKIDKEGSSPFFERSPNTSLTG